MHAVVEELAGALAGQPLSDIVQIDMHRFLLRFAERPFPRVHIAIHPRLSTLHLARGIKAPSTPTELAAELTRPLSGRRVLNVVAPAAERAVRIEFEGGWTIVVELMGKASNLLLLDPAGAIDRLARSHQGAFRRPEAGALYQAPPASKQWVCDSKEALHESALRRLVAGAGPAGPDETRPELRLAASIPGFSVHAARELLWRADRGEDPWAVWTDLTRRLHAGPRQPTLYSPQPPDALAPSTRLSSRNLFAFPLSVAHAPQLARTRYASVNEAEEAAAACMMRHLSFDSLLHSLSGQLRQERRRGEQLAAVLEDELSEAAGADQDRRRGELILAGLRTGQKLGSVFRVIDHYDPAGGEVDIPIDARLDPRRNAERYFHRARKADRTRERIPARLEALRLRLGELAHAEQQVRGAATLEDLESIEGKLQETGLVRAIRKAERAETGRRPEYVAVREYRTTDGFTILVGRTSAENDHLTFNVAAPHDLWLHAAGYPGAHVIVRNPGRLRDLPDAAVLQAAAVAAWFSKGREAGDLDVHVAWRRHVRKGRGMSPGMVMLRRHRTVRVRAGLPGGGQPVN
ncbi:MAG TPA: NFACT family protein [Candidatus Polarisedimenticolia bacterium]|nr:NFACT family protein [Candidatus Polarisedimenticolia bacterium]